MTQKIYNQDTLFWIKETNQLKLSDIFSDNFFHNVIPNLYYLVPVFQFNEAQKNKINEISIIENAQLLKTPFSNTFSIFSISSSEPTQSIDSFHEKLDLLQNLNFKINELKKLFESDDRIIPLNQISPSIISSFYDEIQNNQDFITYSTFFSKIVNKIINDSFYSLFNFLNKFESEEYIFEENNYSIAQRSILPNIRYVIQVDDGFLNSLRNTVPLPEAKLFSDVSDITCFMKNNSTNYNIFELEMKITSAKLIQNKNNTSQEILSRLSYDKINEHINEQIELPTYQNNKNKI